MIKMQIAILNIIKAAGICCFLFSCENNTGEVMKINNKKLGVEEGKNVKINYTVAGKTKAILTAPLMLRVQDTLTYVEFPNTVQSIFYNQLNLPESRLTARYGKYIETRSNVFLKDSVKVINFLKGDTLYTDELYWDRSRVGNEFYTDKPVRIRTKTMVIDGIGMEAPQDFKTHHIMHVTGTVAVPSSKFPG